MPEQTDPWIKCSAMRFVSRLLCCNKMFELVNFVQCERKHFFCDHADLFRDAASTHSLSSVFSGCVVQRVSRKTRCHCNCAECFDRVIPLSSCGHSRVSVLSRALLNTFSLSLSSSFCRALGLWYIVRRTKQCLDFTATVHFFHFIICWCVNGYFPNTVSWWLVTTIAIIIMTVLGEFLCMRTELKAIPLSMAPKVDL